MEIIHRITLLQSDPRQNHIKTSKAANQGLQATAVTLRFTAAAEPFVGPHKWSDAIWRTYKATTTSMLSRRGSMRTRGRESQILFTQSLAFLLA